MYDHVKPGQSVGSVIFYTPAGQKDFNLIPVVQASEGYAAPLSLVRKNFLVAKPTYVVLSRAQDAWGTILAGYPAGWQFGIEKFLLTHNYVVAASWPTAMVLRYQVKKK